jgi:hypothetical protein
VVEERMDLQVMKSAPEFLWMAMGAAAIALVGAMILAASVMRRDEGNELIRSIGLLIQEGAMAFLKREYAILSMFVVVVTVVLALFIDFNVLDNARIAAINSQPGGVNADGPWTALSYLLGAIGSGLATRRMLEGYDPVWFGEFSASATGFLKTLTPAVIGMGAVFSNLEDWVSGGLFKSFPGLVVLGVLYALVWALLSGGVIDRFANPQHKRGVGRLLRSGGRYFFRFVRLALCSAVLYFLIYKLYGWLFEYITEITRDTASEKVRLMYSLLVHGVIAALLVLVRISFDYAKIVVVVEDRRSMLLSALRGIGLVFFHPARTVGVYLLMLVPLIVVLGIYWLISPGVDQSTTAGVLMILLCGQFLMIGRLTIRMSLLAAQLDVYQGVLHPDPTPMTGSK